MAEYTVCPRQKRRRVAQEVSFAMELRFGQLQPERTNDTAGPPTEGIDALPQDNDDFNAFSPRYNGEMEGELQPVELYITSSGLVLL